MTPRSQPRPSRPPRHVAPSCARSPAPSCAGPVRTPVLAIGLTVSLWFLWSPPRVPSTGRARRTAHWRPPPHRCCWRLWLSAVAFHRERTQVAPGRLWLTVYALAPVLAATPLVADHPRFAVRRSARAALGGMPLGAEPGRTTEALHTYRSSSSTWPSACSPSPSGARSADGWRGSCGPAGAAPVLVPGRGLLLAVRSRSVTPFSVDPGPADHRAGRARHDRPAQPPSALAPRPPGEYQAGGPACSSRRSSPGGTRLAAGRPLLLLAAAVPRGAARRGLLAAGSLAVAACAAQM